MNAGQRQHQGFWGSSKYNLIFTGSAFFMMLVLFSFSHFVKFVETRNGVSFEDPILSCFSPIDLSTPIFILIYGGFLFWVTFHRKCIENFALFFLSYSFLLLFRMIMMYSLPLEPPSASIVLVDPLVNILAGTAPLTKDLFFSGHTATLFLLALCSNLRWVRGVLLTLMVLVAASVLAQHVHYTADVLVAPFVSYASYRISLYICKLMKIKVFLSND